MKTLSLTQPWASLVAVGAKRVETRSWTTSYRGPIAIHAAKGMDLAARETLLSCRVAGLIPMQRDEPIPLGALIATAALSDVWRVNHPGDARRWGLSPQEIAFGDFGVGRYAWFLRDIERLAEPIPARGALGLWDFPLESAHKAGQTL